MHNLRQAIIQLNDDLFPEMFFQYALNAVAYEMSIIVFRNEEFIIYPPDFL